MFIFANNTFTTVILLLLWFRYTDRLSFYGIFILPILMSKNGKKARVIKVAFNGLRRDLSSKVLNFTFPFFMYFDVFNGK